MRRRARRIDRLVLLAYPRSFRRDFGDEITRTIEDLRRHRGVRGWRLALRITGDVIATAPRLRLESAMSRTRVPPALIVFALVAVVAAMSMAFGAVAVFLVPLVVVGAAIILATRHDRPLATDPTESNRWAAWAAGGVGAMAIAITIAQVAGEDASEPVWVLWAVSTLAGLTMLSIALVTGTNRLRHRRTA